MSAQTHIHGLGAPIPVANLDTDQIIPKQFLRRIDKAGLAEGLLYDMRFDAEGKPRPGFVLNQPAYVQTKVLVAAPNFGCGSSREHAVWALQQYGIQAVVAESFGEIFYSNAMNNGLVLVVLSKTDAQALLADVAEPHTAEVHIDLGTMTVRSHSVHARFTLSERHRQMFLQGLDMVGATLAQQDAITAFSAAHWQRHPWLQDVAHKVRTRLA